MPIRKDLYERMIRERDAAEREATRFRRWYAVRTVALCIAWQALSAAIVAYAFHAVLPSDQAHTLIDAGLGLAAAGTLVIVLLRHRRLQEDGYHE